VNLERSLKADGRFEGHIVQGHIEGTAEVLSFKEDGKWVVLTVRMPQELLPYVVQKGGIAIDGVSLTISGLEGDRLSVSLIPHTLQVTTIGTLKPGDRVNIETDIVGRYVQKMLQR
jgi:riboflavin synthase